LHTAGDKTSIFRRTQFLRLQRFSAALPRLQTSASRRHGMPQAPRVTSWAGKASTLVPRGIDTRAAPSTAALGSAAWSSTV